ncbi:flavodoxin family protein [Idiomarina aminovorans]|uniref:flavodoxin family protein n=1 Tax=Idiomarina aminovorans TaxID=2914829 RepID=UPI0020068FB5|nr:NAD(P)H-dependent oxidoreductase [Idiomarina sp. ATCH4]MCK7460221.1 NAD(P)H-dependent oxidoreductase [Idiomarina sp. ATCH4]
MKIAVILGSSRSDGNTRYLADEFVEQTNAAFFNLADYDISAYDYKHENKGDDFLLLIRELIEFDHLVFSSPVYWYSMSALLKTFFDRFSDLLTVEKELGRQLKGKSCSVLSTGFEIELPVCFVQPFELTANYMHLVYKGCDYVSIQSESDLEQVNKCVTEALKKLN